MNPTPPESGPTPEQMLSRVIEAQVAGGCMTFKYYAEAPFWIEDATVIINNAPTYGVIEILLSPAGLHATYGDWSACNYCGSLHDTWNSRTGRCPGCGAEMIDAGSKPRWQYVAQRILQAWLSTPEGNPTAAIQTAFDLLPTKP